MLIVCKQIKWNTLVNALNMDSIRFQPTSGGGSLWIEIRIRVFTCTRVSYIPGVRATCEQGFINNFN